MENYVIIYFILLCSLASFGVYLITYSRTTVSTCFIFTIHVLGNTLLNFIKSHSLHCICSPFTIHSTTYLLLVISPAAFPSSGQLNEDNFFIIFHQCSLCFISKEGQNGPLASCCSSHHICCQPLLNTMMSLRVLPVL